MNDEEIRASAIAFAKKNKNRLAKEFTDPKIYLPDGVPISVFMAGSPGAGKTEFSKILIGILEKNKDHRIIRIDSDDVKSLVPGYTGGNSHLFQGAVSLIIEKTHDHVLKNQQTFVLDGTFAKYDKAIENIRRSLKKERPVIIFYLYQRPEIAWRFTEAREEAEGRNIPKMAFIEQFFGARNTVKKIRKNFGREVVIFLVKKDFEKNIVENIVEITPGGESIDKYLQPGYTKDTLQRLL